MTLPIRPEPTDVARARDADLSSYLERAGWTRGRRDDRVERWTVRHENETLRVVLPVLRDAADYEQVFYEALRVVAYAANKSVLEVLADVEYGGADVVSVRLTPDAPTGQAPLTTAQIAVTALKAFVIGSAASLDASGAVLPPRRLRAERYASQVRVSTSPGSFVLTLALPLYEQTPRVEAADLQTAMDESIEIQATPYGRQVAARMRSVAENAIVLSRKIAAGEEDITSFETDPAASGNATELEALAGLGGRTQRQYQVRFATSPVVPVRQAAPTLLAVEADAQEWFGKAARLLRERKPKDDVTVTGKVVRLAREGGLGPGEVVIRGLESGARNEHRYRVQLSDDQYRQALTAHGRTAEVSARGTLAIRGNFLIIESLRGFTVQEALPERPS